MAVRLINPWPYSVGDHILIDGDESIDAVVCYISRMKQSITIECTLNGVWIDRITLKNWKVNFNRIKLK